MVKKQKSPTETDVNLPANKKVFFSKDIQQIHGIIKDYLESQEFENTLECFDHEIKTKILNKRLGNIEVDISDASTPEIFKLMQGETNKTQDEKRKSKIHTETLKKYVDLLTGSRQIFSASVNFPVKKKNVGFSD
jgi:hypothetical protein